MSVIVTAVTGMLRLLLRFQSVKTLDSIGLLRLLRLFTPRAPPTPRRHLKTHPEPIRLPGRPRARAVPWKPFIHHPFIQLVSALFPPRSGLFRPNFTHEGRGVPTRTFPCLPRSTRTEHAEEMIKRLTLRSSLFLPFSPFFSLFLPF